MSERSRSDPLRAPIAALGGARYDLFPSPELKRLPLLLLLLALPAAAGPVADPMRPPLLPPDAASAAAAPASLRLNSTLIATDRRLATINGRSYRVGEAVAGATLVEIVATAVVLEHDGRQVRLELLPSRVRSPVDR